MRLDKEFLKLQAHIDKLIRLSEKDIARNYKKTLDQLRLYMAELYAKYEVEGQLTFYEMSKYNRLAKMDKEIMDIVSELYKGNNQTIKGTLKGIVTDSYTNTLGIVNKATGTQIKGILKPIDVTKTINADMAGLKWTERMHYHRNTAIYDIQKEIKQGLTQGDTYGSMAKRLKNKLEVDINKAYTITRTEGHRVNAQAKADSFDRIEKSGVQFKKRWLSSEDEKTRSQHLSMHSVTIPNNEDFILPDGSRGKMPGLIGQPQHDINCRCLVTMILE